MQKIKDKLSNNINVEYINTFTTKIQYELLNIIDEKFNLTNERVQSLKKYGCVEPILNTTLSEIDYKLSEFCIKYHIELKKIFL